MNQRSELVALLADVPQEKMLFAASYRKAHNGLLLEAIHKVLQHLDHIYEGNFFSESGNQISILLLQLLVIALCLFLFILILKRCKVYTI